VIAYVDSSVILRLVLSQPDSLREWSRIRTAVTSRLAEVECLRTIDRLRLKWGLDEVAAATRREAVYGLLAACEVVELNLSVLSRASQPMPTEIGTLDAIHLSTALLWREQGEADLVMATHDAALSLAARATGFRVVGA